MADFDLGITVTRLDKKPMTSDETEAGHTFAFEDVPKVQAGITPGASTIEPLLGTGNCLGVVDTLDDGSLWLQGVYESRPHNPTILGHTARLLEALERRFDRFEAVYDVRFEWAEIDEDYEDVESAREYPPFLVVYTDMGAGAEAT
jgi:hypothetical protein